MLDVLSVGVPRRDTDSSMTSTCQPALTRMGTTPGTNATRRSPAGAMPEYAQESAVEDEPAVRKNRDRVRRLTTKLAAGALLISCLSTLPGYASPKAVEPADALTLVRQALAALEVTPPAVSVALRKIIYALLSRDTRGVDMARVQEAAHALGALDSAGAAAKLIDALRPGGTAPPGVDVALLTPVQTRFTGTPTAYVLLIGAAALVAAGVRVIRR